MKIGECFPSKYLKAGDLPQAQFIPVQIREVVVETMDGGDAEMKPIVYFVGKIKGLVLNKTNANIISEAYGQETDLWAGHPLLLYVTDTQFQGKPTPCIRVKVPSPQQIPGTSKPHARPTPPAPPAAHATQPPAGNLLPDYPKPLSPPPAPPQSACEQQHVPIEEDQIPF